MALKFSTTVRNARLEAIETAIGASPLLRIYSGAEPAAITDAATGTKLAEMVLPVSWMADAAGASKLKSGVWNDTDADATGTAGYFRIYEATGVTQHMQGNITATLGGGVMTLDNVSIAIHQTVTVTTFTLTDGNA